MTVCSIPKVSSFWPHCWRVLRDSLQGQSCFEFPEEPAWHWNQLRISNSPTSALQTYRRAYWPPDLLTEDTVGSSAAINSNEAQAECKQSQRVSKIQRCCLRLLQAFNINSIILHCPMKQKRGLIKQEVKMGSTFIWLFHDGGRWVSVGDHSCGGHNQSKQLGKSIEHGKS